jgi:2-dehydro-3-deoxyglucarate aldolase
MTDNQLLNAMDAGQPAIGALSTLASPAVIELCADLGFEFVWVDLEHLGPPPSDGTVVEELCRAADAGGIELVVRLPSSDGAVVRKVLDTGVRTLLLPRIETAEEVRRAVEAARFTYDGAPGDRGLATVRANRWGGNMEGYVDGEDATVRVGTMIETREALANLDDILRVQELGFAFVGPWDLSHALGHPLDTDHPDVVEAVATVEERCRAHDVPLAGFVDDPDQVPSLSEQGYRLLVVGSEMGAIRTVFGDWLDRYGSSTDRT